jgi:hypothetical protein
MTDAQKIERMNHIGRALDVIGGDDRLLAKLAKCTTSTAVGRIVWDAIDDERLRDLAQITK